MLEIVPIATHHVDAYHLAMDLVARENRYFGINQAPPMTDLKVYLEHAIANDQPFFAATAQAQVFGWCDIQFRDFGNFRHVGMLSVGVLGPMRGRGVGRALIKAAIEKGWSKGMERIELEVCSRNVPAIHLYRKIGFLVEGVKQRAYRATNGFDDMIVMALLK